MTARLARAVLDRDWAATPRLLLARGLRFDQFLPALGIRLLPFASLTGIHASFRVMLDRAMNTYYSKCRVRIGETPWR